jgi:putative DNA primase/helicase
MTFLFSDWREGLRPPKGWDCADAIRDGWTKADLDSFMRATVKAVVAATQRKAGRESRRAPCAACWPISPCWFAKARSR